MLFWHWAQEAKKSGERGAVRRHGHPLQARWDGAGQPPIHSIAPFRGLPALEVNHPFHFKMTPSMLLATRANHDCQLLLRLPANDLDSTTERKECTQAMIDSMGDHEFYCASYASKEQPHIEGLLHTLADSVRSLEQNMAQQEVGTRRFVRTLGYDVVYLSSNDLIMFVLC